MDKTDFVLPYPNQKGESDLRYLARCFNVYHAWAAAQSQPAEVEVCCCPTCGDSDPKGNEWCSDGFHAQPAAEPVDADTHVRAQDIANYWTYPKERAIAYKAASKALRTQQHFVPVEDGEVPSIIPGYSGGEVAERLLRTHGLTICRGVGKGASKARSRMLLLPPNCEELGMTDHPDSREVERVARAMAESVDLVWEALPEKPDIACGHGMPEGCREYWYYLATAALATTTREVSGSEVPELSCAWGGFTGVGIADHLRAHGMAVVYREGPK